VHAWKRKQKWWHHPHATLIDADGKGHREAGVHACKRKQKWWHQPHATLIETKKIYKSENKHQN
jgi:hypothetical protein